MKRNKWERKKFNFTHDMQNIIKINNKWIDRRYNENKQSFWQIQKWSFVWWGGTNNKNESYLCKAIDSSQLINSTLLTHVAFFLALIVKVFKFLFIILKEKAVKISSGRILLEKRVVRGDNWKGFLGFDRYFGARTCHLRSIRK